MTHSTPDFSGHAAGICYVCGSPDARPLEYLNGETASPPVCSKHIAAALTRGSRWYERAHRRGSIEIDSRAERDMLIFTRFGAGWTYAQLAREFGLSRDRIRQIVNAQRRKQGW